MMTNSRSFLSRILRTPLSLIPHESEVRILGGPLRGKKWIKGSGPNAYWFGRYEVARVRRFANAVASGAVVYDVGANVGMYSLIASSRAGVSGRVYAFEPLERNLRYLRRHISINNLQNCTVVEKAICNEDGTRRFSAASWEPSMARLSPAGEILVPSTTLDNCVYGEERLRSPGIIKVDVEGAELEVLEGGSRSLSEFHPMIFLEIHGTQLHADCRAFLRAKGYNVEEANGELTASYTSAA